MIPPDAVKSSRPGTFLSVQQRRQRPGDGLGKKHPKEKVFSIKNGKKLCKYGKYGILCKYTCG